MGAERCSCVDGDGCQSQMVSQVKFGREIAGFRLVGWAREGSAVVPYRK